MKFKHGKLSTPVFAINGDCIRLSVKDFNGTTIIHEEPILSPRTYTDWLFLSISEGGEIGDAVFMGTDALLGWVQDNFPTAVQVFDDTPVLV